MSEERSITFCLPVQGNPRDTISPEAEVRWCTVCAQGIWVGPASLNRADTDLICMDCYEGVLAATPGQLELPPETRQELRDLGYSEAQIAQMYEYALRKVARGEKP